MISKTLYQECEQLYLQGLSVSKICETKKISRHTLSKKLKENNIKIRRGIRKYPLNEHYFDVIDTQEKAYILGFIYADGNNLFKLNRISIHLSIVDEEILQKISLIMFGEQHLSYQITNGRKYVSINLFSKYLSQHLATLGVVESKSHILTFPEWLDPSLYSHFIRGLIDGDGWIYLPNTNRGSPNVGLICTKQVNDKLSILFSEQLKIKSYLCKAYKQDFDVMNEIRIKNYHQCKILLDWLYKDATIYLERKHEKYQNFLNKYNLLREQNK